MISSHALVSWLIFGGTIGALLLVDLGVAGRRPAPPTVRRAGWWSLVVVMTALAFAVQLWLRDGRTDAIQFATGFVVELSLSIDNLLVFILVLHYFAVPPALQPTVLKWGILGAVLMRGIVIGAGTLVLRELSWVIYGLGILLVVTGVRMLFVSVGDPINPGRNPLVRLARHLLPVTEDFQGDAFVVHDGGRWQVTPLLLVVLVIEWTDLVFAGDSIPAIFGVTRDPYLIYTSNIFAIVGLRALFFVLAAAMMRFAYLRFGVAVVLVLVGMKMLVARWVTITPLESLAGIILVLGFAVAVSWRRRKASG